MDAVEYVKQRNRMCNYYVNCSECPVGQYKVCASIGGIPKLIPIIEQWAKEHPVKTRQSEFLKIFPEASMLNDEYLNICPAQISSECRDRETGGCYDPGMDCGKCKHDFWLKEIE